MKRRECRHRKVEELKCMKCGRDMPRFDLIFDLREGPTTLLNLKFSQELVHDGGGDKASLLHVINKAPHGTNLPTSSRAQHSSALSTIDN